MKNTNINNTNKTDDIKYILMLCKEQKDLILKLSLALEDISSQSLMNCTAIQY